jgi:hypothetical protein
MTIRSYKKYILDDREILGTFEGNRVALAGPTPITELQDFCNIIET